jgi:hypothetical protein
VIIVEFDTDALNQSLATLPGRLDARLREGLESTCEAIAARARGTTTYQDRTGALRASTQSAGTVSVGSELVGTVSFAARSKRGYLYGLVQEFGNKVPGIHAKKFIRDAIDAQDGVILEGSLGAAFEDAGFTVVGG